MPAVAVTLVLVARLFGLRRAVQVDPAMARLRAAGYVTDRFASPEGNLVCRACGTTHDPHAVEIRETVRFEGDSNPDDEATLLAVSSVHGCLGQFSAAFGPDTAAADARVLQRFLPNGASARAR